MKRLGILCFILSVVLIGCKQQVKLPTSLKAVKNYSDYSAIGVANISNQTSRGSGYSGQFDTTLVGLKDKRLEKVRFIDDDGKDVTENVFLCQWNDSKNFFFFSIHTDRGYSPYCLHLPSGNLFPYPRTIGDSENIRGFDDRGDVVFNWQSKITYTNGKLIVEDFVSEDAQKFFREGFLVDRYENIFSYPKSEYAGKLRTTDKRIVNIPARFTYAKGQNGRVYYFDESKSERGYFGENGVMIELDKDSFFPLFIDSNYQNDYYPGNQFFEYSEGDDLYRIWHSFDRVYLDLFHFKFMFDEELSYTEEKLDIPNSELFGDNSTSEIKSKFYQIVDNYLYLLTDNEFCRIDFKTGQLDIINNSYVYYYEAEYLSDNEFRVKVMDEYQNKITIGVNTKGEVVELSKSMGDFFSVSLNPIPRI